MAKTYTAEQREEALALYVEHGPAEAGRICGVPSGTIRSWAHRAGLPQLRYKRTESAIKAASARTDLIRQELRELLLDQAVDLLHRMNDRHKDYKGSDVVEVWWDQAPSGATKDYATAAAILIDKYRLEMGESTTRTHVEGSDDIDRSVRNLVAELDRKGQAKPA